MLIVHSVKFTTRYLKMSLDPKTSKKDKKKVSSKAYHPEMHLPLIPVADMSIEKNYEPFNWLDSNNEVTMTYLIDAAQRHLDKIKLGIDINTEEKTPTGERCKNQPYHAACVAYNMLMLCLQMDKGVAIDDRMFIDGTPLKQKRLETLNELTKQAQELNMGYEDTNLGLKDVTIGKQEEWEDINDYLESLDTNYKSHNDTDVKVSYKLNRKICKRCNDFVFSFHHHQLCLSKGK